MVQLMPLGDAQGHVGEEVHFAGVIQRIASGKRTVVDHTQPHVPTYHVLHLADATQSFFKLTCWDEQLPTLSLDDHAPADIALCPGDIALFTKCLIKSYHGNFEAQFTRRTSNVQLLYRKDRYLNTRDVQLKDLYPMIEWYKQHRRDFLVVDGAINGTTRTKICDLRENMVATVVCKLYPNKSSNSQTNAAAGTLPHTSSMEWDDTLLCELVMQDSETDSMIVNLWDQHAENKFVTRLLNYQGAIMIEGIVVSVNGLSNCMLVNTTPETKFHFLKETDKDAMEIEQLLGANKTTTPAIIDLHDSGSTRTVTCSTIEELESFSWQGRCILENVRVEQISFDHHLGGSSVVLPKFAQLLVECYCSVCNAVLPELQLNAIPPLYGLCPNKCRVRDGQKEKLWRYRRFRMMLRDSRHQRLRVCVESNAVVEMVGNIPAEMLVYPHIQDRPPPFNVQDAVTLMLNSLVGDGEQAFHAEIDCQRPWRRTNDRRKGKEEGSEDLDHHQQQLEYSLLSLVPSPLQTLL